jgi:hypothetical protein
LPVGVLCEWPDGRARIIEGSNVPTSALDLLTENNSKIGRKKSGSEEESARNPKREILNGPSGHSAKLRLRKD